MSDEEAIRYREATACKIADLYAESFLSSFLSRMLDKVSDRGRYIECERVSCDLKATIKWVNSSKCLDIIIKRLLWHIST